MFNMLGQGRKGKSPSLVGGSQTKRSSLALTFSTSRICGPERFGWKFFGDLLTFHTFPPSSAPNLPGSFVDFDQWPRGTAYHMQASNWGWSCAQKKPVNVTRETLPFGSRVHKWKLIESRLPWHLQIIRPTSDFVSLLMIDHAQGLPESWTKRECERKLILLLVAVLAAVSLRTKSEQ